VLPGAGLQRAGTRRQPRIARRNNGTKSTTLPDFFIGAHAAIAGLDILTRDIGRYRTYFPTVSLIAPDA